ncbi:hypothetical protein BDC45DRAFT_524750 [Circinella umbellata]|nr:hypothetical protein BDC45DRAFT_524750 [Circinella umbellata]
MFDELDSEKFWTLSTGTVVELQMKKFALTCIYEHMILDIADDNWKGYFTKEELAEIELIKKPTILELPDEMIKYLDNYKNLETLTDIWNENNKHNFHPINQPVMNWVDTSVARAVDILLKNIHNKYKTEADLMKRIWVLIDCCFDDGELDSISGEYVSKATTEVANSDRTIAATNCMSRRKSGTKTDLLFTTEFLEFGTCEAGKITDANNTKTLCELGKKLPKTLKDMMFVLAKECPSKLRELKTCGFIISGLNILPVLMDCPDGYVARINRPSRFFHHPTNASNFLKNMRSIVRVIYDAKVVMNNVSKVLDSTDDDMNYGSHSDIVLPLSFKPTTIKPSKKRKINSAQSE